MKKNYLFLRKPMHLGKWVSAFCMSLFLIGVTSCQDGFDDNERFSGGVTGVTLESPKLDKDNFTSLITSDGKESVKVTWPVVLGAGGYLVNVKIVDDPSNPVVLVDNVTVDGCSAIFERFDDTKYEVSIKALGNEKLNNKEAESPTVYGYTTLIPATTIPEGQELAAYFKSNLQDSNEEQGFELLGGKTYRLDDIVDFGLNTITLRGDKANRPTVILGANGGFITQSGLKLKFVNFDCTESTQSGFLSLSKEPSESILNTTLGYDASHACYIIEDPVVIQECNIKNLQKSLLYGNTKNWGLFDFRIIGCIVQMNNSTSSSVIRLDDAEPKQGSIKSLTVKNNTFSNLVQNKSGYFIRYANSSNSQPKKIFGSAGNSASITIENNTFSHVMSNKNFANNMTNQDVVITNIHNNIFYDVFRLYEILQGNAKRYTTGNTIFGTWGGSPNNNDIGGRKDLNGNPYATLEDPEFVGPFEIELDLTKENGGVNFTPRGPVAVENQAGDPRWYE